MVVRLSFSLLRCFSTLRDPRTSRRKKKHLLIDIIAIAICAVIAGADDWPMIAAFGRRRIEWLKTFLELPNGIPSHDTFERVFNALSPQAFQGCFLLWVNELAKHFADKHFTIDGKALRGSLWKGKGLKALHLVSVWAANANLSLGEVAVNEKSNEIKAIPKLLELLDLNGALVTIDAMGCQKAIAKLVVDGGGDYLFTVKGNQGRLYEDILKTFNAAAEVDYQGVHFDEYETEEKNHGRYEKRHYKVIYDLDKILDRDKWQKLTVIGICCSERTVAGKTTEELRLFIGSRMADAQFYAQHQRGHWGIENGLHWQLDVTFGEDDSRIKNRNAAENFALLRRLALSLIKKHKGKDSVNITRFNAALDVSILEKILQGG